MQEIWVLKKCIYIHVACKDAIYVQTQWEVW